MNKLVVVVAFILGFISGLLVYPLLLLDHGLSLNTTASSTTIEANTTTITTTVGSPVLKPGLEITYAYAQWNQSSREWLVTLKARNTGFSNEIIDEIFINGRHISSYTAVAIKEPSLPYTLEPGEEVVFKIIIKHGEFGHGATIEIKLHIALGREFPKQVTLP